MCFLGSLFTRNTVSYVPAKSSSVMAPPLTLVGPNSAHNSRTTSILKARQKAQEARKRAAACRARARPCARHRASTAPILADEHMFANSGSLWGTFLAFARRTGRV